MQTRSKAGQSMSGIGRACLGCLADSLSMATSSAPSEGLAGKAVPLGEGPTLGPQPRGTATRTTSCPKDSTCSTSYILRKVI